MSKQSYMTGFCKAASAAGVDPQALAQYVMSKRTEKSAQESKPRFQTNGWVPSNVSTYGIPKIGIIADDRGIDVPDNYRTFGELVDDMGPYGYSDLVDSKEDGPLMRSSKETMRKRHDLLGLAQPEYKEWLGAHTNAINGVLSKYLPAWNGAQYDERSPRWLEEAALRDYNKAMFDATNTPVKVESPKK